MIHRRRLRRHNTFWCFEAFIWMLLGARSLKSRMRCLAFVIILQSATCYVGSFDLPKPLDNFYEEVVRFYKRLRSEGGKQLIKHLLFAPQHVTRAVETMLGGYCHLFPVNELSLHSPWHWLDWALHWAVSVRFITFSGIILLLSILEYMK